MHLIDFFHPAALPAHHDGYVDLIQGAPKKPFAALVIDELLKEITRTLYARWLALLKATIGKKK